MATLSYLRAAAGVAWRAFRGRPCACGFCREHRRWVRESANSYRAEVRGLIASHGGGGAR